MYKTFINPKVESPMTVNELIKKIYDLSNEIQENFGVICLNTKNDVIGMDIITKGTVNASIIVPRDIIQRALLVNATNIIIFHNHPSGNPYPSDEDKGVTDRIKEACNIMGIKLLDHIIVGENNYYSFKESFNL